jgi:hypothetical protein
MNQNFSRRHFIRNASIGISGAIVVPTILSSCAKGANDRILIGHIGVGSRGTTELLNYFLPLREANNIAVCDVFRDKREKAAEYINNFYKENKVKSDPCLVYSDYEELLQNKEIDAVHITTPDHWHIQMAIKAARAGKHIMLAKPLGLSYPEYKILIKELNKNDVRFHYGPQQRTYDHLKLGYDIIRDGKIGEIERVDVWAPEGQSVSPPCNEASVPDDLDYERWIGPAPMRPYCPERTKNLGSWFINDYSIGWLAGWGAHPLDIMVWIVKEKVKGGYTVTGTGKIPPSGSLFDTVYSWDVAFAYRNGFDLHFSSFEVARQNGMIGNRKVEESNGTTFYGSKGWISLSRRSAESNISEIHDKLNNFPKTKDGYISSENNTMGRRFISVVREKEKELCPLDEAIISDTISHMGNIAIRTGRKITWDPKQGQVVDDSEANNLYSREMRSPYLI